MNIIAMLPTIVDFEPSEIWVLKDPKRGDHIRVCRMNGLYYHHGIYISEDEVIHFTGDDDDSVLDWSKARVIKTDLKNFLRGGEIEVKEYTDAELDDLYPVEGIVSYARACLGDDGYNLIFNNCEHFANACTLGKYRSRQVENVLGGKKMGILGTALDVVKGFFGFGSSSGSRSTKSTTCEPDKVKIAKIESDTKLKLVDKEIERVELEIDAKLRMANKQAELLEIERDTKLKLADKEAERIELMRDAQIELIKAQAITQAAIEKARVEGMAAMANQMVILQEKMLDVAKKRMLIIEKGALPVIHDIEKFYKEIGEEIQANREEYKINKLPQLLEILSQYEVGSIEHQIYSDQIRADMKLQEKFLEQQLACVIERQNLVMKSFISSKEKILDQTWRITQKIAERYLPQGQQEQPALPSAELKQLPPAD